MKQLAFNPDSLIEYYLDTISTNQTKFNTNIERKIYLSKKNEKISVDSNGKMRNWEDGLRHPHFGFAKIQNIVCSGKERYLFIVQLVLF